MSAKSKVTLLSNEKQNTTSCNSVTYFDMEQKKKNEEKAAPSSGKTAGKAPSFKQDSEVSLNLSKPQPTFTPLKKKTKRILNACLLAVFYLFCYLIGTSWKCCKNFGKYLKRTFISANRHVLGRSVAAFAVMVLLLGCGYLVLTSITEIGYKVLANDVVLGTVREKSDYYLALSDANADIADEYGDQFLSSADVTFEKALLPQNDFSSLEDLTEAAYGSNENLTMSYMVTIDGIDVISTSTLEDAQKILDGFKNQFLTEQSITAQYTNEITIEKKYAPKAMMTDVTSGITFLNSLLPQQTAAAVWTSVSPQAVMLSASADSSIVLTQLPQLEVVTVDQVLTTETIPFETETVENPDRYVDTDPVVIQEGVEGEKSIGIEVTKSNGTVVSEVPVEETVTKEPVNQVIEVGSKPLPTGVGTGSFEIPVSGYTISSKYGYRHGSLHTGIDLAVSYGTSVRASDEGIVTFSGWKGGYGYLVIVDHQNGYETYYAHNSKLLVEEGQIVEQGETIAKAGSTGNSTGPHCHFEIRKNGSTVNPYSYIF